jgi:predicted PurR-regulated permease PerM
MQPKPVPVQSWTTAVTFMFLLLTFLTLNVMVAAPFLLTVVMGGILALLLFPQYQRLRKAGWASGLSSFVLTLAAAVMIIAPMIWFTINAYHQGISLAQSIASDGSLTVDGFATRVSQFRLSQRIGITADEIMGHIREVAKIAAAMALSMVQMVPQLLLHLVIALLTCLFLLRDGRKFMHWFQDKIPLDPDARRNLFNSFKETAVSVIWASLLASTLESILLFTGFVAIGVPAAFLAGAFAFILSWIPIVGTSPVWIIGAIHLTTHGRTGAAITLVIIGLSGGILNNLIRAWVIRGRNNLHPMVSLVTIIGGIGMFGLVGVFIGPILAAVLLSLLEVWPAVGRRYGLLRNPSPAHEPPPRPHPAAGECCDTEGMKPYLATWAVLVFLGVLHACSSTPTSSSSVSESASASPTATPYVAQPGDELTPDDALPNFKGLTFNAYPMRHIRPRIVEITVETTRSTSAHAGNRVQIEQAVRSALETALKRSNITVVSRSQNKINFTIKDCRNLPDATGCIALDAVFRSPKFELEVGGYSHNDGQHSDDLTRAYYGAINAVMERLNKQLEIVGAHQ